MPAHKTQYKQLSEDRDMVASERAAFSLRLNNNYLLSYSMNIKTLLLRKATSTINKPQEGAWQKIVKLLLKYFLKRLVLILENIEDFHKPHYGFYCHKK